MPDNDEVIQIIPSDIEQKDYWIFQVRGISWMYIMKQINKLVEDKPMSERPVIIFPMNNMLTFMFKRKLVPIEEIMKRTGMKREAILTKPIIKLVENYPAGIPEPNVSGWGEA